jgi:hypothetical protein
MAWAAAANPRESHPRPRPRPPRGSSAGAEATACSENAPTWSSSDSPLRSTSSRGPSDPKRVGRDLGRGDLGEGALGVDGEERDLIAITEGDGQVAFAEQDDLLGRASERQAGSLRAQQVETEDRVVVGVGGIRDLERGVDDHAPAARRVAEGPRRRRSGGFAAAAERDRREQEANSASPPPEEEAMLSRRRALCAVSCVRVTDLEPPG